MSNMGSFNSVGPVSFGGVEGAAPVSAVTTNSAAREIAGMSPGHRVTYKGEEYVLVHNAQASTALAVGDLCTTSALSGYSVTNATSAADELPLCVVKHAAIPSAGYGWGLVRGVAEALSIDTTCGTGVILQTAADGEAQTFVTGPAIGKVLSSGTSACKAYVKLFG